LKSKRVVISLVVFSTACFTSTILASQTVSKEGMGGTHKMVDNLLMLVEKNVPLQAFNTFHIVARAHALVRIASEADVQAVLHSPDWASAPKFVLGGGSNIVLTGDVKPLVLKVEVMGCRLAAETPKAFIVEAGAGEGWHSFVAWTLAQGYPGLENMALIPGTVGASPVQNVGAYGVELQDRFESLDAIDLSTGQLFTLNAAQCAFGYRDSVFKHASGWKDRALILRVRFSLPKAWKPVLGYADIEKKMAEHGCTQPTAQQLFDWVCEIRRAKLPDPDVIGNAGSFFKNPTVTPEQCEDIIARDPKVVHYRLADGSVKLAAGWLIDSCGWRGKSVGQAGVYEKQALVLVNRGAGSNGQGATGGEVMTLAKSIQTSVYERFGILMEPEPVVV
jgi:UDP-N-acetylmuramate dehydrogenase